jgi:predicted glycoside hydrolase/deacetylase ChbG (UPF0249 family)
VITVQEGRGLIVNADDLGLSEPVDRGIMQAYDDGIVTSASLLVHHPHAVEAAAWCRARPDLDVGLHIDLGEWRFGDGEWVSIYEVVDRYAPFAVHTEVRLQLRRFHELLGVGPSHIDSHQHVHRTEPARSVVRQLGEELGVPVRGEEPSVRYSGAFYGQTETGATYPKAITVEALLEVIASLPPGVTELGCHPGYRHTDPTSRPDTMYLDERALELDVLCDDRVSEAIHAERITLLSFRQLHSSGEAPGRVV